MFSLLRSLSGNPGMKFLKMILWDRRSAYGAPLPCYSFPQWRTIELGAWLLFVSHLPILIPWALDLRRL
jgi:hypothetical protein